jgi:glucose dehydrogenase
MLLAKMRFAALLLLALNAFAQTDWPSYGNDPGAMRYSSLRQIHTGNVERLKIAWTFRAGKPGSEAVPIVEIRDGRERPKQTQQ